MACDETNRAFGLPRKWGNISRGTRWPSQQRYVVIGLNRWVRRLCQRRAALFFFLFFLFSLFLFFFFRIDQVLLPDKAVVNCPENDQDGFFEFLSLNSHVLFPPPRLKRGYIFNCFDNTRGKEISRGRLHYIIQCWIILQFNC